MKARAQLQNGCDSAVPFDFACGWLERSRDEFQERALSRTVVPNHAHALASTQLKRHIAQRPMAAVVLTSSNECAQSLSWVVVELVFLAQLFGSQHHCRMMRSTRFDVHFLGGRCAHNQSTNWSLLRRSKISSTRAQHVIHVNVMSHADAGGQCPWSNAAW